MTDLATDKARSGPAPDIRPTGILAEMASGACRFTEADRHQAVRALIDTVACMIAARESDPAIVATEAVRRWGAGRAITARGDVLAAPWAAFVNGTTAHAQDYDDVLEPASAHVSAVLVPALMALSAELPVSGTQLLDAYLAGFEVMARLGEAFGLIHYSRGWHTTLTLGAPAAAAATARLAGLDTVGTATAISQSMSMSGGSKLHMGKIAKPVQAGLAAKAGLLATSLAEAGTTTNEEVFAGAWGAIEMMAGPDAPGFIGDLGDPAHPTAMSEYGVWLKAYPSCASTHRIVDGALALVREHGFRAADVARVDLTLPLTASQNLMFDIPTTPGEARFSAHYCVAHALMEGHLGPAAFDPERLSRPDLKELMARISRQVTPTQRVAGADLSDLSARVQIELVDGSTHRACVEVPYGHPGKPLSDDDLDAKFLACAEAGRLGTGRARRLLQSIRDIRAHGDLSTFDWFGSGGKS